MRKNVGKGVEVMVEVWDGKVELARGSKYRESRYRGNRGTKVWEGEVSTYLQIFS